MALLTDLDNTLFNWIDYFGSGMRVSIAHLSMLSGVAEDVLYDDVKQLFVELQTPEYWDVFFHIPSLTRADRGQCRVWAESARDIFLAEARRCLVVYPEVAEGLAILNEAGVAIAGVTNAAAGHAIDRLHASGLAAFVDVLVAWDGVLPNGRNVAPHGNASVVGVRDFDKKPSHVPYTYALQALGIMGHMQALWAIGDSVASDLVPAAEIGAHTIWASYGCRHSSVNYETVVRLSQWNKEAIRRRYAIRNIEPNHTVNSFAEAAALILEGCKVFRK
jgi:FMN phosphatase YigB (HAD superfamily)